MNGRFGWLGLGNMGAPMARRLLVAGCTLAVHNRTPARAESLLQAGATWADSPRELAAGSDIVLTMLADGPAVLEVALGERGVLAGARPGLLLIDLSTISPAESAHLAEACVAGGVDYLRAPVTGSTILAAAGTLGILVSGSRARFEEVAPLLGVLGQRSFYLGPAEEARAMKLALNLMVGLQVAALAEALTFGEKSGLDWHQMLEVFTNSAVSSPLVRYKSAQLESRSFAPAFTAELIAKDCDLALDEARRLGVSLPLSGLLRQLWQATIGAGWGQRDLAAILLLLEQASGLTPIEGPREVRPPEADAR